jgi:MinD-like ATPase involved in chromosome partitioning or flagellar assembly
VDGTETGWGRPAEPAPRWRALLGRARHTAQTTDEEQDDSAGPAAETRMAPGASPLPSRPVNPLDRNPLDRRGLNPLDQPSRASGDQRPVSEQRPVNPLLDRRPVNPLDRRGRLDGRPADLRGADPRQVDPRQADPRQTDPRGADPRPLERPVNPLDSRRPSRLSDGFQSAFPAPPAPPLAAPSFPASSFPASSFPAQGRPESLQQGRPPESFQPPPRNDGFASRGEALRAEAEQPHNFFNPPTRPGSVVPQRAPADPGYPPADPGYPPADPGYPPARAAASVGSAAVLPAPAAPVATPAPTSPAPARIEWRQTRSDQDLDRAVQLLRRKLGKPRVLAFANPKGGVHKTTATVLAAATIGSVRGRGVLAWDDNELRGTLGLRAGSARHARTIRHLISDLMQIENMHGEELLRTLDDYLRHASDGSYDVLAGEENPRFAQRLDQSTVHRVMELLRRTHDVICVDTGNNVESVNWQTVMKAADQLVITTVPREDAAFTADWMLDLLNDTGMEELAANAVTLISCPSPGKLPLLDDLTKHFATRTRGVAVVPYDPALEVGSSIEYSDLQPETRSAWLRAASVMIEPFAE